MGPPPWPGGAVSVRLVSSFFFHGAFYSALFHFALGGLTANASLDCLCLAEVYVDGRGAPLDLFPLFASFLC